VEVLYEKQFRKTLITAFFLRFCLQHTVQRTLSSENNQTYFTYTLNRMFSQCTKKNM